MWYSEFPFDIVFRLGHECGEEFVSCIGHDDEVLTACIEGIHEQIELLVWDHTTQCKVVVGFVRLELESLAVDPRCDHGRFAAVVFRDAIGTVA